MKRVIYSLYVDIPAEEHYGNSKIKFDTTEKASITINAFKKHYKKLLDTKKHYASRLNADFLMFENDNKYKTFETNYKLLFPQFTGYEIINFYKIHLLYELAKKYDEILYLDFDVIPNTDENFFDVWDLSKGIAVLNNNERVLPIEKTTETSQTIRSPNSKYYNTQAMLLDSGISSECDVINTGIIGVNKEHLYKLAYFNQFDQDMIKMTQLKFDTSVFPKKIVDYFGYDNETLFGFKLKQNKVPVQWLDDKWHYFFDKELFIPKDTKFIHAINKRFDIVWRNVYA